MKLYMTVIQQYKIGKYNSQITALSFARTIQFYIFSFAFIVLEYGMSW